MDQRAGLKRRLALTVCIAFFAVIFLFASTATAQDECDQLVIDEAGVFNNRAGEVEAAARELISSGADVRIRTIQTYGGSGNLDRFESELEQQCPSWTDAEGNRKNNLVVLMIALEEQQTGLYYGSRWESTLGSRWTQIQTDIMNPRFAQGDFAGGFVAGLEEINRLITGQTSAQEPSQGRGGLSAGLIVLFVVIFIVALLAGLFIFRNYRKSREKRLAARQKALLAKQGAASKVNSLVEAVQMLEIKVNATAAKVSPEDAAPLFEGLGKAKRLIDQGAQKYSELGHSAGNPENPGLGEAQLQVIALEYQKVLEVLREGSEEVDRVEADVDALQQAINGFDDKITELKTSFEAASRKIESAQNAGFNTGHPAGMLSRGRRLMEQAIALSQLKKFLQAQKTLSETADLASRAAKSAEELPQKKQEAEAGIQALAPRIEQVKETIIRGKDIFERISSTYAESSWESIQGNGSEAENRIEWTLEALEAARTAASAEQQDWYRALDLVKQGNSWMDEAESFMHSISAIETSLEKARQDVPGEIAAAQADITKAWKYINAYDEDIRESLEDDLREAERKLNRAYEESRRDKADYLMAVKLAEEANESADKILVQARTEHEAAERMRSKAASAIRDAQSRVSITREYIRDHGVDAGDEARNLLANAEAALQQAEAAPAPETRLSLAEKAESMASKAYSTAKTRVEASWKRRRPAIPPVIILPGGGSSRRSGASWGSRRSSPWSSGGGGVSRGGSTGWGVGRGGGGSTRW